MEDVRLPSSRSRAIAEWHHVKTEDNPASRGVLHEDLATHHLWWTGPSWFPLQRSEWLSPDSQFVTRDPPEAKPAQIHFTQQSNSWDLANRYSYWPKLVRVTAYILRFIHQCRRRGICKPDDGVLVRSLSAQEYAHSTWIWLKLIQSELFPQELKALHQRSSLSSKSPIVSLNLFLDENGLIRVGRRIQNAPLSFERRHPVLLAAHPVVLLIIKDVHLRSLHSGLQLTLITLRQQYWIMRARNLVKRVIHQCVPCVCEKAEVPTQLMGQLPSSSHRSDSRVPSLRHRLCGPDSHTPVSWTRRSFPQIVHSRIHMLGLSRNPPGARRELFHCRVFGCIYTILLPSRTTYRYVLGQRNDIRRSRRRPKTGLPRRPAGSESPQSHRR